MLPENPVIAQPSCVQVAVSTEKVVDPVRAIRNVPSDTCTVASEPVDARAEPAAMLTDTVLPATVPATDPSGDALDDGELGLLPPPQAANAPMAMSAPLRQAPAQKSRRVGKRGRVVGSVTDVSSSGRLGTL